MGWTFYNSSGEALTSFGPVALTDLDIDGGTDVGEAIVDADLFIIDNGAGGTNVKTAASRLKTYIRPLVKTGSFTRDTTAASGTQAITGVGFTVKAVIFFMTQDEGAGEMSMGLDDGTTPVTIGDVYNDTNNAYGVFTDRSIRDVHSSGNTYNGSVTTLGTDGFTVTWSKAGSPTGTITVIYLAIG